ncbi:MAG TPA: hypothetical protein VL126_11265 [Bacteroidota bacterium]|nr:hypothetical protein [Bacteroidota bacterium]
MRHQGTNTGLVLIALFFFSAISPVLEIPFLSKPLGGPQLLPKGPTGDPASTERSIQMTVGPIPMRLTPSQPTKQARPKLIPLTMYPALISRRQLVLRVHNRDEIEAQRCRLVDLIAKAHWLTYSIEFAGFTTALDPRPPSTDHVEMDYDEQRKLGVEIIDAIETYEDMIGLPHAAERRDEYLKSLRLDRASPNSINMSDESVHVLQAKSTSEKKAKQQLAYHEEQFTTYEKQIKTVGFDKNGNPIRAWHYDIVLHRKRVPN